MSRPAFVAQDAEQRASDAEEEQLRAEQEAAGLAAELRSLQASLAGQHGGQNGGATRNGGNSDDGDGSSMMNDAQVPLHGQLGLKDSVMYRSRVCPTMFILLPSQDGVPAMLGAATSQQIFECAKKCCSSALCVHQHIPTQLRP